MCSQLVESLAATVDNHPPEAQSTEDRPSARPRALATIHRHRRLAHHRLQDPATQVTEVSRGLLFNSLPADMEEEHL